MSNRFRRQRSKTDGLRRELYNTGVDVIEIIPQAYKNTMTDRIVRDLDKHWNQTKPEVKSDFVTLQIPKQPRQLLGWRIGTQTGQHPIVPRDIPFPSNTAPNCAPIPVNFSSLGRSTNRYLAREPEYPFANRIQTGTGICWSDVAIGCEGLSNSSNETSSAIISSSSSWTLSKDISKSTGSGRPLPLHLIQLEWNDTNLIAYLLVNVYPFRSNRTMKRMKNFFSNLFSWRKKTETKRNNKDNNKKEAKKGRDKDKHKVNPKTKPLESIPTLKNEKKKTGLETTRLTSLNGPPMGQNIYDVCAYVMVCDKHNKIVLSREEDTGFVWFPFVSLPNSRTWSEGCLDGAYILLSNGDPNAYLQLKTNKVINESYCMQLPQTQKFNIRVMYFVKLVQSNGNFKCCQQTGQLNWYPISDVLGGKSLKSNLVRKKMHGSLGGALDEEELLKSANYGGKDVERIYGDFIEHCFPAFYMTITAFVDYMAKYGFDKRDKKLPLLFKAFNFSNSGSLTFSELLIGLSSIEPNAANGQSRIKFVFKYFDTNGDGFLSDKEFEQMVREIYPKESNSQIQQKVTDGMKQIGVKKNGISFEAFFKACGSHKFRGTSGLCRSKTPLMAQISRSIASRSLGRPVKEPSTSKVTSPQDSQKYKGVCKSCRERKYDYAIHTVRLNSDGRCVDAKRLKGWDRLERSKSSQKKSDSVRSDDSITLAKSSESLSKSSGGSGAVVNISRESFSVEYVWNPKSVANYFLEQIRAFNLKKGSHKDNKGLMDSPSEHKDFVDKLQKLCKQIEKILAQEDRCVRMSSPAYIIGDIHGNLEDLLTMEKVLWKSMPIFTSNLLFLGDYVDRGKWGVECAIYILCLKLLAPNKVVMLRGNHEVRDLQIHYSYQRECIRKYGEDFGKKVFEMTNRVFDRLPVCAVIDDAIFCSHGGIPCSSRLISKINEIKTDLKDPEHESAIAWEILWSDPIGAQQFIETAELLQIKPESTKGFLTNTKRGTAFLFAEDAANNFLQTNGLTHIVRAHEVPANGYTFHFGNKCVTVFSSSHYCGNNNLSACVHVDNEKLRIIRLDTVNNAPACD
ncbi:unnamed protein product [Oppiella nova]|uniref:Serine/threonine-protein phosphatase n=1 Tax=Oppiella nova TaxID=334625 RepID=A0A7R9LRU4_9ACAR|nr:unnamed protein product [Oppiella nova]CAG2166359.1 unnamed protein product [Oppiella nova]